MSSKHLLSGVALAVFGITLASPAFAHACGKERWPVKTLTDKDAGSVNFTPKASSVKALRNLTRPKSLTRRTRPVETTTYRIKAQVVSFKREEDEDIHLVVADPNNRSKTMISEFPAAGCTTKASSSARQMMKAARTALTKACGSPPKSSFRSLHGQATLTGVGFFDFKHHQRGLAPNAIELHPVLGFSPSSCT